MLESGVNDTGTKLYKFRNNKFFPILFLDAVQ